ncbi:hypothetical protein GWK47_013106 [Chionoecetes opilio]|uniref:Uncharacterized protein n=1 Tax=Chionoecetes opilio TaxID=41210 RepID=A0A8J4XVQ0_CHIOP|nr:hypothetical protein GWK47_013106 [Chionoecetes opilio]
MQGPRASRSRGRIPPGPDYQRQPTQSVAARPGDRARPGGLLPYLGGWLDSGFVSGALYYLGKGRSQGERDAGMTRVNAGAPFFCPPPVYVQGVVPGGLLRPCHHRALPVSGAARGAPKKRLRACWGPRWSALRNAEQTRLGPSPQGGSASWPVAGQGIPPDGGGWRRGTRGGHTRARVLPATVAHQHLATPPASFTPGVTGPWWEADAPPPLTMLPPVGAPPPQVHRHACLL